MTKQLIADGWPVFDVLIPGWASTIRIRATDGPEACQLAGILFKTPWHLQPKTTAEPVMLEDETPAPTGPAPAACGKRGRPALAVGPGLICDTLGKYL